MFNFLLDLIFPKYCLSCNKEGEYWCVNCRTKPLRPWQGCFGCRQSTEHGILCAACQLKYAFDSVLCVADYDDEIIGPLIKACKYRFIKELTKDLALVIIEHFKEDLIDGVIIPVPLSAKRERWRGFNQAAEIGRVLAQQLNLEYRPCVIRIKHKKAQAKLNELERLKNMAGCFVLKDEAPEKVILIDDVITTGATVNECARVLRAGGAEEIRVVTLAKG